MNLLFYSQKGITECYECHPKPTPKQYAYCTIRSFPKEPIHCIVWAKEEFSSYFGGQQQIPDQLPDDSGEFIYLSIYLFMVLFMIFGRNQKGNRNFGEKEGK